MDHDKVLICQDINQITELLQWSTAEHGYAHSQGLIVLKFLGDHSMDIKALEMKLIERDHGHQVAKTFLQYGVPHHQ